MKPKKIITDSDGVLLNWNDAFTAHMYKKGYSMAAGYEHEYKPGKRFGLSYDVEMEIVKDFNESFQIGELEPIPGAVEFIQKLNQLHGFRFTVVTSVGDHPATHEYRMLNLKNHFGDVFDELKCLPLESYKLDELSRWKNSGLFWIEDSARQAIAGTEAGLNTLLISTPSNIDQPAVGFQRARDWEHIYEIICAEYGLEK
jgi:beta-phosphoglucomutase-like phosphatase (HAD superfamily)